MTETVYRFCLQYGRVSGIVGVMRTPIPDAGGYLFRLLATRPSMFSVSEFFMCFSDSQTFYQLEQNGYFPVFFERKSIRKPLKSGEKCERAHVAFLIGFVGCAAGRRHC
ncbi:hypothetical protein F6S87_08175 [Bifidobacterium sp. BRDM6]|uniref:Uncharacterized protein n=1 Tax=Bifidobacterium choloepi TaxID=2614131 RepID=A0A6I5N1S0_9BIFI|nr:hypothetical protein [Bifidobacterium choloepi]